LGDILKPVASPYNLTTKWHVKLAVSFCSNFAPCKYLLCSNTKAALELFSGSKEIQLSILLGTPTADIPIFKLQVQKN
jgi:hypothetical protein